MKTSYLTSVILTLPAALSASAAVIIDYAACQAVAGYSQARMDAIAQLNFYFERASVGGNIIGGLSTLHTANGSFYQLTSSSSGATPPTTTSPGIVYYYDRGNPGWQAKVDTFAADLAAWNGHVDIALNKFCYIDESASVSYYENSMATLETTYPGTHFVYMTMPLMTSTGSDNVARNQFNTALRQWVSDHDKILFDIADIEAHAPGGVLQTFDYGGQTYEMLYSGYTSDGGHLNATGSELVARGFYALGNALAPVPEPSCGWILMGLASAAVVLRRRGPKFR